MPINKVAKNVQNNFGLSKFSMSYSLILISGSMIPSFHIGITVAVSKGTIPSKNIRKRSVNWIVIGGVYVAYTSALLTINPLIKGAL